MRKSSRASGFRQLATLPSCLESTPTPCSVRCVDLRDEGLLEFRRGRGVTVIGTPAHAAVAAHVKELVRLARRHGYRRDELIRMLQDAP